MQQTGSYKALLMVVDCMCSRILNVHLFGLQWQAQWQLHQQRHQEEATMQSKVNAFLK